MCGISLSSTRCVQALFQTPAPACLWMLLPLFPYSILGARSLGLRHVSRDSVSFWARHPSLFLPSSTVPLFNSANSIRARVGLVGESLLVFPALSGAAHPLAGRRPLSVPSSPMPDGSSTLAVVVPFLYLPFSFWSSGCVPPSSQGAPQHSLCFGFAGLSGLLSWFS